MKFKKNKNRNEYLGWGALLCIMPCIFAVTQINSEEEKYITYVEKDNSCLADAEWFNGSPIKNPKEGPDSPFAFGNGKDSSTNCNFHKWSWQKFLYLTQKEENSDDLVMFGEDFYQVNNSMIIYRDPWNDMLNPTGMKKAETLILEDSTQADTHGILYTKKGKTPVYYSIHINKKFLSSVYKAIKLNGTTEKYEIKDSDKFSVGSVELKISWIEVKQLKNLGGLYTDQYIKDHFYIRNALFKKDNKVDENHDNKVAMVGMHVVGIVENHPEFIWATFEHSFSTPDYYTGNPSETVNLKYYDKDRVISNKDRYIFYTKDFKGSDCSLKFKKNDTLTKTNTFRMYQYGVPSGLPYVGSSTDYSASKEQKTRDSENFENIDKLNASVLSQLSKKSIWSNYFYSGSIWLSTQDYNFSKGIKGDIVGPNVNNSLRGSLGVSNITMETFFQTKSDPNMDPQKIKIKNCFSCHEIDENESTMNTSHIFKNFIIELNNN